MAVRETHSACSSNIENYEGDIDITDSSSDEQEIFTAPLGVLPYQYEPGLSDITSDDSSSNEEAGSQTDPDSFQGLYVNDRAGTIDW